MFRRFLTVLIIVFGSQFVLAQSAQPNHTVDAVKYFDENKRWYQQYTEHWFNFSDIPESEVRKSIQLWEFIGQDLSGSSDKYSGTYGSGGDTHGSYLRWSKGAGFILLHVNKCQGGPTQIIRGRTEENPDGVRLIPETVLGGSAGHGGHGDHKRSSRPIFLVGVRWRGETYLIDQNQLSDFSDYAAGLGSYNNEYAYFLDNSFLSRLGSEPIDASNETLLPVFPKQFEKLIKTPVRGTVISIGPSRRIRDSDATDQDLLITRFQMRLEKVANARASVKLHPVDQEPTFTDSFEIRSVSGKVATVEQKRSVPKKNCVPSAGSDCAAAEHIQLRIGLKFSSNGL
jgi:hypothetical protein